ncbi:hypothetical protein AALO_G00247080 [Alosa alosa]|uniref:Uncharacterized protein n=1 Tax=Alosa alosa TaxID=278164 RepID=A0AAV6FT15_9TELE|nr:hypothetical protein AALO_G00247080 [Alosa alosa]
MVCENVGNEFCKHPAWYRLGTEVLAVESRRDRGLQEVLSTPAVVTTELESSCACLIIGLACFVMFIICLWIIKSKRVCSKCGGRLICQCLKSLEQLLVKVRTIEQRMGVLEDSLPFTMQLTRASLDEPLLKEDQSD